MTSTQISEDTKLARQCIRGAIAVSLLTVVAVAVIDIFQPTDAARVIVQIIGITSPIVTGLFAFGMHGLVTAVDGRMTQLIAATAEKEHAKGALEGLALNPGTNVEPGDLAPAIIERRKTPREGNGA